MPGATIGIIGGGQLGRMMATTAKHMGYRIAVLDPTEDCPAAQLCDEHIVANYSDLEAIKQLAEVSDVITYEFENVDLVTSRYLEKKGLLPQGSELLRVTQDRENEKSLLVENNLPVAPFKIVHSEQEFTEGLEQIGIPSVLKTCTGGYDGKGQFKIESVKDLVAGIQFIEKNKRCILEKWLPFDKEVSVVLTRSTAGDVSFFPLAENEHKNHILHKTIAPARVDKAIEEKAFRAAQAVAEAIGVVGTFAIEMFVRDKDIYINEMAPRPHNSGHYTIEACSVSQFEQHVRAICGLPHAPIFFHGAAIMINLLGQDVEDYLSRIDELKGAHIHIYGKKEIKENRKMGHITFVGNELGAVKQLVDQVSTEKIG